MFKRGLHHQNLRRDRFPLVFPRFAAPQPQSLRLASRGACTESLRSEGFSAQLCYCEAASSPRRADLSVVMRTGLPSLTSFNHPHQSTPLMPGPPERSILPRPAARRRVLARRFYSRKLAEECKPPCHYITAQWRRAAGMRPVFSAERSRMLLMLMGSFRPPAPPLHRASHKRARPFAPTK